MSLLVSVSSRPQVCERASALQTAHVPRPNVYCTAVYGLRVQGTELSCGLRGMTVAR
jgi:hypothetical protein